MTKAMQELVERVSQLPEDEQERVALRFLEELDDDARWDDLLNRSPDLIDRMADEALREEDEGRTTELRGNDLIRGTATAATLIHESE